MAKQRDALLVVPAAMLGLVNTDPLDSEDDVTIAAGRQARQDLVLWPQKMLLPDFIQATSPLPVENRVHDPAWREAVADRLYPGVHRTQGAQQVSAGGPAAAVHHGVEFWPLPN